MTLLDVVELVADLPEHNLRRGEIGTIVEEYPTAYEVEFCDDRGRTTAMLALLPTQIRSHSTATDPADQVARLARGLIDLKLAYDHQVVGCTEAEVVEVLKSARGFPLPEEYLEFLRRMGRETGRLLIGTDFHYPAVLGIPADAARFATEDAPELDPAGKHFFAAHQGYQFYFFTRERPGTVFLYTEGDDEPVVSADTFLDWLWNHAESAATISSRPIHGTRFPS